MHRNFSSTSVSVMLLVLLQLCLTSSVIGASFFTGGEEDDLYSLLGVERGVTKDEIKRAFRTLTREHHPDLQESAEGKEKAKDYMAKVLHAYSVLSDDLKRQDYDQFGKISGERLNSAEYSSEELFRHFNQNIPILSKSVQLGSLTALQRILNFRGNRLFLIQVYDDSCDSCRLFSSVWESLVHSTLSEAGVIQVLRIDAYSAEGPALLKLLGASYDKEVQVYGVVDGVVWNMPQLQVAIKSRSERQMDFALLEFIGNFFYDRRREVNSMNKINDTQELLNWLREPRGSDDLIRILLPPLATIDMGLALSVVYENSAVVRYVPRTTLLALVEEYCAQPVDVLGSDGQPVPMPEFIVTSVEQLPNVSEESSDGEGSSKRSCRGILVGASAALTYRKATSFLRENIPQPHPEMLGISHVTGSSFYTLCGRHCLILLQQSCVNIANTKFVEVLRSDLKPFEVGYVCLNEEPSLQDSLALTTKMTQSALMVVVDGNDSIVYLMSHDLDKVQLAEFLSGILQGTTESISLNLETPISRLLASKPFKISNMQYAYMCILWLIGLVYPFASACYPFFIMFVSHKLLQRFNLIGSREPDGTEQDGQQRQQQQQQASQSCDRCHGAVPCSSRRTSDSATSGDACDKEATHAKSGGSNVPTYTAVDLLRAKDEKVFLVLVFTLGEGSSLVPQRFVDDPRFVFRKVPDSDTVWRQWLSTQQGIGKKNANEECDTPMVAVRQGKMLGAVKPYHVPPEVWLFDLLEGAIVVDKPLPQI
uniref:Putative chaperone protein DNAj n=1 Tax=Trypanosoma congolense (strain IL3000) TaxID=1068625 RepID=G0V0F9_TRYCI|nr:putative chaperone protein DNAj [Trypanosoma congolense IL3000]